MSAPMSGVHMKRFSSLIVCFILSISFCLELGCVRKPDDAKISSDIQSKFSQDSGLSSKQIAVQAENGVVTLNGNVDNDAQRQAASRRNPCNRERASGRKPKTHAREKDKVEIWTVAA